MLMTSFSAVADITPVGPKRAFRISVVEAVQVMCFYDSCIFVSFPLPVSFYACMNETKLHNTGDSKILIISYPLE